MPTLDFKGKQFVYSHHLSVPFRELKVVADKSLPQQGKAASLDDNLIIHGDNLEALKALLPTHAGKVDCIFIDPPYNTGNEGWCYNDNVRSPLMQEWLKKSANPVDKEDLERHDKWLCMMWPRLILLRELLNENGSIFITIGDDEQHALRLLLDEIFGRENFITSICWKRKVSPSNDAEYFSSDHDWLLVYAKNQEEWSINRLPMNEGQLKNYTSSDDDERGAWSSGTYTCNKSKSERPNLYYGITNPNTGEVVYPSETAVWKFSQEKTIALQNDDMLYWGKDGKSTKPRLKKFLSDAKGVVPRSVWDYSDSGSTQSASIELSKILMVFHHSQLPNPLFS
ncbi:site-specific DNA-methyltransferase [Paraglaciecola sp. Hal342]